MGCSDMSIFHELNHVKLNLSEFEEEPLSAFEQKRILKHVKKEISQRKHKKNWLRVGISIAAICILSVPLVFDKATIAGMPFVGEVIEKYINPNEDLNYSSYKTVVGETAENRFGKLTLNEVMMDDQRLFLSSTFEPAKNVHFDYQSHITPTVKINGKSYTIVKSQSIQLNDSMFTIYNDIELSQAIETENLQIQIVFDKLNFDKKIEQPWTYNVTVSQAQLLKEKKVHELNKTIELSNGDIVNINKVVSTPISTTVYYDLSKSKSENIYFNIQMESGAIEHFHSAYTSNKAGDLSYVRFDGLDLVDKPYFLTLSDFEGHSLYETPIPIN